MDRARLGSLLGLLCSGLLAISPLVAVNPYPPGWPYFLWGLCGALFIASASLWFRRRWGRVVFLVAGTIILLKYAAEIQGAPGGCAGTLSGCYNHYIQSNRMLAVARYFVYLSCSHQPVICCSQESIGCYKLSMYVQPALTLLAMLILLKPLASNNRWRGP
jgi:hypothetical protein